MRDRIYVHVTWTTRDRERLINRAIADFLAEFLPIICRQERANLEELGMVQTHVHLLVRVHPNTSIPRLLQRLKGGSSVLVSRYGYATDRPFGWAKGYDVESVSPRNVERGRSYIRNQDTRHPGEAIEGWSNAGGYVAAKAAGPDPHRFSDPSRAAALSRE